MVDPSSWHDSRLEDVNRCVANQRGHGVATASLEQSGVPAESSNRMRPAGSSEVPVDDPL